MTVKRKDGSGGSRNKITLEQFHKAVEIMDSSKPFSGGYIARQTGLSKSVVTEIGNGQRYIDNNGELATHRTPPSSGRLTTRRS